ncbi:hypothetical protein PBI_GAIA_100 [Mycobacterium phage Gaia]|uniref:Uncharacterized protein n=1 Tax=Mycobacterium phage Gaia TaxID=1486472 RepID=A0A068F2I0_9CAUD|nr:hypothetical protein VC46_gp133 [Mycobacterium phage Gaia]AID58919.1 hypothetical protein PBI_GAIA_100 [Mycobacterium phage Gaia]AYR00036.1 hypothetical protein PBI_NEBKISS_100 [Mycobacterium phage Nebkiss]
MTESLIAEVRAALTHKVPGVGDVPAFNIRAELASRLLAALVESETDRADAIASANDWAELYADVCDERDAYKLEIERLRAMQRLDVKSPSTGQ